MNRLALIFMFAVALTGSVCGQGSIRFVSVPGYGIPSAALGSQTDEFSTSVHTSLDLNNDGVIDFVFRNQALDQDVFPGAGNAVLARPNPLPDLTRYASPLPFGTVIGSAVIPGLVWAQTVPETIPGLGPRGAAIGGCKAIGGDLVCLGDFLATEGYLGLEFLIDGAGHYGWMHLVNEGGATYLHGYAYNTIPGQPILAGQVPEPSAWILILCGLVAGSLMVQRRRTICSG